MSKHPLMIVEDIGSAATLLLSNWNFVQPQTGANVNCNSSSVKLVVLNLKKSNLNQPGLKSSWKWKFVVDFSNRWGDT